MAIPYMHAIDFNMWMTLLAMTRDNVVKPEVTKYVAVPKENVLPQFPRDLTQFAKPSIIIQKVATEQSNLCFGHGYLGQMFDEEQDALVDVYSRQHEMEFQYDIFADSNWQESILTGLVSEKFINFEREIPLLDFTADENNPTEMGVAKVHGDINIMPMGSNENKDYRTAIRFYLNVIQTVIPAERFVDLAKWIKVTQHVRL